MLGKEASIHLMAKYIYRSVLEINKKYESDPRNIWKDNIDSEILKKLTALSGIGRHKAIQCLIYLNITQKKGQTQCNTET